MDALNVIARQISMEPSIGMRTEAVAGQRSLKLHRALQPPQREVAPDE